MKVSIVALALVFAGCGNTSSQGAAPDGSLVDAGPNADAAPSSARYFPMQVGATWEYQVTENGVVGSKTQTVLALEDVGGAKAGVMAFKVQSTKSNGKTTLSWQEDTGTSLIRHKEGIFASDQSPEAEELYQPSKLRIDESSEHLVQGASFDLSYSEESQDLVTGGGVVVVNKTETWTVVGVDVSLTVPAGTFSCIQLRKVNAATGSSKDYWFARGVGKVREEGAAQIEELSSYSLP